MARIDGWKMQFFSTKGTVCEALWHFGNDVVDFFLMLPGRYSNLNQFLHSKKSCRTIHDVVFPFFQNVAKSFVSRISNFIS